MTAQKPWLRDLAQRAAPPAEAAARARRGRALVDAALRGEPVPEPAGRPPEPRPAGYETVACPSCYRPVPAPLPGTLCAACRAA